ncbi:phosphoribosylanthranilate isomerase [Riemerella anatipestifer]|uniref:N-(5'-phosphoribosyl)anthranilate isomerase n=1 Tax=Riemerella anatipestifer TaxID=34085 RepID=A0AAP3EUA7_RIEAN|nr:phosphoribosylanthranilate isomerase [Riemerella anatipestifer]AZZ57629.1 phosphoribosylanthranilate isomerase [Riemerella anatipestifer]MBT0550717.1 phosphoribosylanthranilate isomerase [Riemerella anatipestifer]MBT0553579.1 phosphoribosylanthranilate isomerase [Riemerella anatipestifer]MBT0571923.1 phosphoribosylanthranilate isomerase [Riemerella anatipestifer]MCE3024488.1 phosphoribosylanthranilate isomerase [Riemerella anatipestifer]
MKPAPKIKVCGLTDLNQIREIIDLEIDYLGFIFYEKSPRYVLNHLAPKEIASLNHRQKVGVFVNETTEKIVQIITEARLNLVQLHGDETSDFIRDLKSKLPQETQIIKVIRVGETMPDISDFSELSEIDFLLFDTDSKAFGGTGKRFDWQLLNELNLTKPYFLSGGISNENIGKISIIKQKPIALDLNSKFEISAGNKEVELIKNFKLSLYQ